MSSDNPDTPPKTAEDSRHALEVPAFPWRVNELGQVKAGHMLKLMDIAGSIPPLKHLGPNHIVVTAAFDRTNFINPIFRWELMHLESRLTRVWQTSMETQVSVTAWNLKTQQTRPIATAYMVFVGLDADRNKLTLPPLSVITPEDQALADAADIRKQNRQLEGRQLPIIPITEEDHPSVLEAVMTPNDANLNQNVFGGVILEHIDRAGSMAAKRHALDGTIIGVRVDRMSFLAPAFIGETLRAKAIVTKTWRTSMEVQVEVEAQHPHSPQPRAIASSYLVYVKLDPNGHPVEVPPLMPFTDFQQQRAAAAEQRRALRQQEEAVLKA